MEKRKLPKIGAKVIKGNFSNTPDMFIHRYVPIHEREKEKEKSVAKSDKPEHITNESALNAAEWISSPIDQYGLKQLVDDSTILPQCIKAYKDNIAGFGLNIRYNDDYSNAEESTEMKTEFDLLKKTVALLNLDYPTKEIFEKILDSRETYGIGYLECIRNLEGHVVEVSFIIETPTVTKTYPLDPYIETTYYYKGEPVPRKKQYRKYRQQLSGKTVYFKEFGDPRLMDKRSGLYYADGTYMNAGTEGTTQDPIPLEYQANEILEFKVGELPYGEIRWIGQVLTVDGNRRAEVLNNNYFRVGRHTPLMILIKNGILSDESVTRLKNYMDEIKGENGQHSFLLLEAENNETGTDFETPERPDIEIKDMASILQKDELFQDYEENGRKKVQSAFLLPDLYVGYTKDFNRATAQAAIEVTEKQVFQPERLSLAWIINNRLLNDYGFRFAEVFFESPDITNPDDIRNILAVTNQAGGLSPNVAKELTYKTLGKDNCEDYDGDWGDTPLAVQSRISSEKNAAVAAQASINALTNLDGQKSPQSSNTNPTALHQNEKKDNADQINEAAATVTAADMKKVDNQIAKAAVNGDDDIVPVLKEIRKALREYQNGQKGR